MKNQIQKTTILKKNLTLTGMMGVGKSTIGKKLAKKLNYKFIDIGVICPFLNYIFSQAQESSPF